MIRVLKSNSYKKASLKIRLTYYLLLGTILFVLLLLTGEVVLRLTGKYQVSNFVYDKELIWRLKRNHHETRGELKISFNKDGFRGRDFPLEKPADTKRIIVLGDSYTFGGIEYSDEQIFSAQLEKKLNQYKREQVSYEVMNVSVPAWGTDQQLNYLRKEGISRTPDYLILMISPNDIRESYRKKLYELVENNGLKRNDVRIPRIPRIGWYLANHSSLFQLFQSKILHKDYGTFSNVYQYYPVNFGIEDSADWDRPLFLRKNIPEVEEAKFLFKRLLLEIANTCAKNNCKLLVAIIPTKAEFSNSNDSDYQPGSIASYLDTVTTQLNVPYLNLYDKAKTLNDPLSIFMSLEYHFNKVGHTFAADNLFEFFKENE